MLALKSLLIVIVSAASTYAFAGPSITGGMPLKLTCVDQDHASTLHLTLLGGNGGGQRTFEDQASSVSFSCSPPKEHSNQEPKPFSICTSDDQTETMQIFQNKSGQIEAINQNSETLNCTRQ